MSVRPLCAELQQIAERELNEVPNRVPQDLQHIREWLLKQPHLNSRMDAQWLIVFLRGSKFSLERTKEKLEIFYTARTHVSEVFSKRDPFEEKMQEVINTRFMVVLPHTLQYTMPWTVLVTTDNLNPNIHTLYDVWKIVSMAVDMYLIEEDTLSLNGAQAVIDLKNCNFNYVGQCTPTLLKNLATILQKAYPVRIKKVVIINANSWFITIWNAFKLLLSNKMKERLILCDVHCGNLTNEYSIPNMMKQCCAEDTTWDALAIDLKRKLEKHRDWFLEDRHYGVDGTKLPEKTKILNDIYGTVQGSFRNLHID